MTRTTRSTATHAVAALLLVFATLAASAPAPPVLAATSGPRLRALARDTRPNPDVILRGSGWGHSVGLSQYGSYAMALRGKTHGEILRHYYRGIAVERRSMPARVRVGLAYRDQTRAEIDVTAVTNTVPWLVCGATCSRPVVTQPEGQTWTVQRLADGRWRLLRGSTVRWTGGGNKRLVANFNPNNDRSASIRTVNPNSGRAWYRYGRLELRPAPNTTRRIWAILVIKSVERYLRGLGEVPNSWGLRGPAALRAQAVAARTYAVRKHESNGGYSGKCACTLVATPADQVYSGYEKERQAYANLWIDAVNRTASVVATYGGRLIETFYSSSHGGRSENVQDSYAFSASTAEYPYLRSVADPWSTDPAAGNPFRRWSRRVTNGSMAAFAGLRQVRELRFSGRTDGGSPKTLVTLGLDASGQWTRRTRSGEKGIVGISLKQRYPYPARGLSTLPSQQIRSIGFAPFRDDDGTPQEYAIVYATQANLIDEVNAKTFGFGRRVSRAQMANAIFKMLAIPRSTQRSYSDVRGHPYEVAINSVADQGIMSGTGGGKFSPSDPVPRGLAALNLSRALQLPGLSKNLFDDDDALRYEPSINRIAARNIIKGCGERRFCPARPLRREVLASALHRAVTQLR